MDIKQDDGGLTIRIANADMEGFSRILMRALNCWEPQDQPTWAMLMADIVDKCVYDAAVDKLVHDVTVKGKA